MEMLYPKKYSSVMLILWEKNIIEFCVHLQLFLSLIIMQKNIIFICLFFLSRDRYFVQSMDFTGMEVDEALRVYQTSFRLPVCFFSSVYIQKLISINLTICCKRLPVGTRLRSDYQYVSSHLFIYKTCFLSI